MLPSFVHQGLLMVWLVIAPHGDGDWMDINLNSFISCILPHIEIEWIIYTRKYVSGILLN